jgi:hypothetical protein
VAADLDRLLELAERVLLKDKLEPELVQDMEAYSSALAECLQDLDKFQSHPENGDKIKLLAQCHSKILGIAEALRGNASKEMRELRKRGKGLRAYVGTLPKRISVTPTRKG